VHFTKLVSRRLDRDYVRADPLVGRWKPTRGFSDAGNYITTIDSMEQTKEVSP